MTAGRRGSGKTTTLQMIIEAIIGCRAAASPWSPNEEERRKALLSYFMYGMAYILWDNITRGAQISCPHIEKSCTTGLYADRKLGVSEMIMTAASTIHCFTGNNIRPRGDLASRSLQVRLDVDRIDPENRNFKHPDPIGWTRENRGKILRALYTILLGNPALKEKRDAPMKTRFKMWYRLVGAAVEHAVRCAAAPDPEIHYVPEQALDFGSLFLDQEGDDEDATSLAEMLHITNSVMTKRNAAAFKASDVAEWLNISTEADAVTVRGFLFPNHPANAGFTAKAVGKRLKAHVGEPVRYGEQTLVLRSFEDKHDKVFKFHVAVLKQPAAG